MSDWQGVLVEPAKLMIAEIGRFLMNLLMVILILIIGWIISKGIKMLVIKLLKTLKVDDLSERIELDNILAKGGIQYTLTELIGVVFYWVGLLVTFVVAINAVGLTIAADLLNQIILYVPNVIAAIFILISAMFVATILKNIVKAAATNIGLAQANVFSKVVEVVIMVFAIAIALQQLGIGSRIIELTISIILGAFGLSLALAFGLGCRDIAEKATQDFLDKLRKK